MIEIRKDNKETPREKQVQHIVAAKKLITKNKGNIDNTTPPFKNFDAEKYDRFLIQKGTLQDKEVVFKVGTLEQSQEAVKAESRNLKIIDQAVNQNDQSLNINFIKQAGDILQNNTMIGLATEYKEDDKSLKETLTAEQKINIIAQTINSLQQLKIPSHPQIKEIKTYTGKEITKEAVHFSQELETQNILDSQTAEELSQLFKDYEKNLKEESLVFCHSDCHGDNIFVSEVQDKNIEATLLDLEELKITNKYHDWCELLNKASLLKHFATEQPEIYEKIQEKVESMWLSSEVNISEDQIAEHAGVNTTPEKINFKLTRVYDMLHKMMAHRHEDNPLEAERRELFTTTIQKEIEEIKKLAQQPVAKA